MFYMYLIVTGFLRIQRRSLGLISACGITFCILLRLQVFKSKHYPLYVKMFSQLNLVWPVLLRISECHNVTKIISDNTNFVSQGSRDSLWQCQFVGQNNNDCLLTKSISVAGITSDNANFIVLSVRTSPGHCHWRWIKTSHWHCFYSEYSS